MILHTYYRSRFDEIYTKLEHGIQSQAEEMTKVLERGKKTIKLKDKSNAEVDTLAKTLEESRR